jgi:integrase
MKVTLSAIFTEAKRKGRYEGVNPMQGVSIPKGKKHGRKRLTYSLAEIERQLDLFEADPILILNEDGSIYAPEISSRVVRAIIGVAAFAGLREGEIRGLWWEDDELSILNIRRSVWRSRLLDETKTHEDEDDPRRRAHHSAAPSHARPDSPSNRIRLDVRKYDWRSAGPRQSRRPPHQASAQGEWSAMEGLARLPSRARHKPSRTWNRGQGDSSDPAPRGCQDDTEKLYQDGAECSERRDETTGRENCLCSRCAAGLSKLIRKLLQR